MQKISGALATSQPLYSIAATRQLEARATTGLPAHALVQRAGLAVARLALALAPHARKIWIACGPGNNGGDGFEAAAHLHRWGKTVVVTWTGVGHGKSALPPDAQASREHAIAVGVPMAGHAPEDFDFCIDALLGIGASLDSNRSGGDLIRSWVRLMYSGKTPVLAVDIPSCLGAETGKIISLDAPEIVATGAIDTKASGTFPLKSEHGRSTLALLTLKPGLFTADGRDAAGEVWFDDLGVSGTGVRDPSSGPCAWLMGKDFAPPSPRAHALHASHKGSFGDVAIVGGESTASSHMAGAALLAARAALHAGAGRVFVSWLATTDQLPLKVDALQPELMFRDIDALDLGRQVVVCGCGGGSQVRTVLPGLLSGAKTIVLDADALNAIAGDSQLQTLLKNRAGRGYRTVLTPHPLEAARWLGVDAAAVQADRLSVARQLAETWRATVVLKGSGTVIAAPGKLLRINSSGNPMLATAGTGDVLAGMVGAWLASGLGEFEAACGAVFAHGRRADAWAQARPGETLTASVLATLP